MTDTPTTSQAPTGSSLQQMIDAFNAQFSDPAPRALGTSLPPLKRIYVPSAVSLEDPHTAGAQIGVGKNLINSVRGMVIVIQPYLQMSADDAIDVYFGNNLPIAVTVEVLAGQVNQNIEAYIPPGRIPPWTVSQEVHELYCVVKRVSSANPQKSPVLYTLVRQTFPGGNDPQPDRPGHYKLLPPALADLPANRPITEGDLVDDDGLDKGVNVTIPAYPHMRQYDTIQFSWNGYFIKHLVLPEEVNQAIIINVPSEAVREAGDGEQLILIYLVWDECYNVSSDWSLRGYVDVEVDPSRLAPPVITRTTSTEDGEVLDLRELGGDDLTVEVWVDRFRGLVRGDKIQLTWRAFPKTLPVFSYQPPIQTVPAVTSNPKAMNFVIPNAYVKTLAMGTARASYTVTRANSPQLSSTSASVSLIGDVVKLPAPSVPQAVDGILDVALASVKVVVLAITPLEVGDTLQMNWNGLQSDGITPLTYSVSRPVTPDMVGTPIEFLVNGAIYLAPLEGGSLQVSYQVRRQGLQVPLESTPLALQVGAAEVELPAPSCPEAQNGELDPGSVRDITIVVVPYDGIKIGQTIRATWRDENGPSFSEDIKVTSTTRNVVFTVPYATWSNELEGEVLVTYQVIQTGKPTRVSAALSLRGVEYTVPLPDPVVVGASDGMLTPAGNATVRIPLSAAVRQYDEVHLKWEGDNVGGSDIVRKMVMEDQVADIELEVLARYVEANIDANVRVSYTVYRFNGDEQVSNTVILRIQRLPLPMPVFVEATAGQQLNPDDVLNGATVLIDAVAHLKLNDKVTVTLTSPVSAGSFSKVITIVQGQVGVALRVTVPYDKINASNRQSVTLKYSIVRASGGPVGNSPVNTYTINRVIGTGPVRIFGARYGASTYRASSTSRILSAFKALPALQPPQPILAEWRYKDETNWTAGTTFFDRQPWKALRVRTQNDEVELNPANIIGNGVDATVNGSAAFVALRDERGAGVRDMVGWGHPAHGASIPPTLITFDDIAEISCSRSAYAARRANGFVVCWGNAGEGGSMRANETGGFVEVRSNSVAFVGRKQDGRLSAWGSLANGADIPPLIIAEAGYKAVYGAGTAFCAQKANGQLVAWGSPSNGGTLPAAIATLTDVFYCKGNYAAFAARRTNSRLVAWGNAGYGGTIPTAIAALTDVRSLEGATAQAFSALRATGQVIAWGAASHGGTVPEAIASITDVIEVTSTWHAFCARRRNGAVVAWGNASHGGTVPNNVAQLHNIVQVTGSAWAFAALCSDGRVYAWGRAEAGGDTSQVAAQLTNVRAIYANSNGFTALTSDGRVVTWGQPLGGGDSSAVQPALRGLVTTGNKVLAADATATPDEEWVRVLPGA